MDRSAQHPEPDLARVAVVGTSCSGKTTLAGRLARALDAPHVELDALHWGPGWQARPSEVFEAAVAAALEVPRWICDGNYGTVRDRVWSGATAVVWLDYPFPLVFARALRRTVRRVWTGETIYSGNVEGFRHSFLSRESILLWVMTTHRRRHRRYAQLFAGAAYAQAARLRFAHPRETERFVARLEPRG